MGVFDGLKDRAPGLHKFLTRRVRPFPLVREITGFLLVALVAAVLLWGLTGQPFPQRPVVVVESASMMHCDGHAHDTLSGDYCKANVYGRFGTIDPGDLIFVRAVDDVSDVTTCLQGGTLSPATDSRPARMTCGDGAGHYGHPGDVLIYRPDGITTKAPIIHRAIFYLQINADRTFTIPELGAAGRNLRNLDNLPQLDEGDGKPLENLGVAKGYATTVFDQHLGPEASGWIMLGDNNDRADQQPHPYPSNSVAPARPAWVLGKARGEIPWIGMVNLGFQQLRGSSAWYSAAPGDIKTLFVVSVLVVVSFPWVVGFVQHQRHKRSEARDAAQADAAQAKRKQGEGKA